MLKFHYIIDFHIMCIMLQGIAAIFLFSIQENNLASLCNPLHTFFQLRTVIFQFIFKTKRRRVRGSRESE